MKAIHDKFSDQASSYAKFRPHYSDELYEFLFRSVGQLDTAWDCGTGNGQVAIKLAERFKQVYATDISQAQLAHASQKNNISYILTRCEHTNFADNTFDLISVAQAIHWFDFDAFYNEVRRVGKPNALLAVWGYGLATISPGIDALVRDFYTNVIGTYWDAERKYIEEAYLTIPFPFRELELPPFNMQERWSLEHFIGYLDSWSAVENYVAANKRNPVRKFKEKIQPLWYDNGVKEVRFPIFMRVGVIEKL